MSKSILLSDDKCSTAETMLNVVVMHKIETLFIYTARLEDTDDGVIQNISSIELHAAVQSEHHFQICSQILRTLVQPPERPTDAHADVEVGYLQRSVLEERRGEVLIAHALRVARKRDLEG